MPLQQRLRYESQARVIQGGFKILKARKEFRRELEKLYAKYFDENLGLFGRFYYFNKKNRRTQWTKPMWLKNGDDLPLDPSQAKKYRAAVHAAASRIGTF